MKTSPQIDSFCLAFAESVKDGSFARISLGHYKGAEENLKNISVRKVKIRDTDHYSFTHHYKTRDIVKNHDFEETCHVLWRLLTTEFYTATLFTTSFNLAFENIKDRKHIVKKSAPTEKSAASTDHNRSKKRLVVADADKKYLQLLKITGADGKVLDKSQDKYRQIDKYVEILSGLLKDMPADKIGRIVDMGSGKGYLTFALYDYLTNTMKLSPEMMGIEYRQDMVDLCNDIAEKSGFGRLRFQQGTIEKFDSTGINILIALHACDTATDDAIQKGIEGGAELIVVAPCCHKQIRREIEASNKKNDLEFLLKYGTFTERQSEMVTDGMRAMILEYFGYSTKVFEFISDAHTPKNVLIVAQKNSKAVQKNPAILKKFLAAKEYFGIRQHHLEKITGI